MTTLTARRSGMPVPSPRGLRCVLVLAGIGLCAPLLPLAGHLWPAGLGVFLLLLLIDWLTRPAVDAIAVQRDAGSVHHVGREGRYALVVENATGAPLRVVLRDFAPAAAGGTETHAELRLAAGEVWRTQVDIIALRRGSHAFPPLGLGVSTGLGLLEHRLLCTGSDRIRVAPGRPSGEIGWLLSRAAVLEEIGTTLVRRPGADWEFESLRDYVSGDEPRRIDWKASARRHRPMVRTFETERNTELMLALDCGRLMGSLIDGVRKLDLAMTPLLDLAAVALKRGERVGMLAFDSKPRIYLPPRPGMRQLHAMTSSLADLPECDDPTSYLRALSHLESQHRKRMTLIVFTDFTDEITARDLLTNLASLARRHLTVFVAVSDPHLERVFAASPTSDQAIFEKAVAGELGVERRMVLDRVQELGIPTLDAEPQRLTAPLLNRYLELRMGGAF